MQDFERIRVEPVSKITDELYVGNIISIQDPSHIASSGIQSIISLNNALDGLTAQDLGVAKIANYDFVDGAGNDLRLFERVIRKALDFAIDSGPLLIQCQAGRSRSVVTAAGFLMVRDDISSDEALHRIAAARDINVSEGIDELLDYLETDDLQKHNLPPRG